jgi:hypothetical protein
MENQQQSGGNGKSRPWAAYNIVERGGRRFWNRVGSAFHNRDGSMNIFLDSLPRDGKIQIREDDREPRKERGTLGEESVESLESQPAAEA